MRNPKILVLDRGEELASQLQALIDDFRPQPEIIACTRMGAVGEILGGLGALRRARRRAEPRDSLGPRPGSR